MPSMLRIFKPLMDPVVTLILWTYYILGYIIFFSPFYLAAYFFSGNRETAFQRMNHIFYRSFFILLKTISPGLDMKIDERITSIKSSVVICNHLSYLDPILMISLFERQKTVVRSDFFSYPVFGWLLKTSGYIPSTAAGDHSTLLIERIEGMNEYLAGGGNLFIFPEGHRSRDGRLGPFNKGSFRIAKRCRAPISVLMISNTDKLFTPGKFLFNTCAPVSIKVELIGQITPDYDSQSFSLFSLMDEVRFLFDNKRILK